MSNIKIDSQYTDAIVSILRQAASAISASAERAKLDRLDFPREGMEEAAIDLAVRSGQYIKAQINSDLKSRQSGNLSGMLSALAEFIKDADY